MFRDFFLGFVRIHILHHAVKEPIYGAWMMEELKEHGYEISPGTLYPILHSMEEKGYLACEERVIEGHVRKYYTATEAGRQALGEVRRKMAELVGEVLAREPRADDTSDPPQTDESEG
jgi:DNA-binding PadR family transcriptional regulator